MILHTIPITLAALLGTTPAPSTQAPSALETPANFRALIEDAATRTTYTAPPSPNFNLAGFDEVSNIRINGYVEFRYTANRRDTSVDDNDLTQGFGFREVRLGARGSIASKDWTYLFQGAFDTGSYRLTDLWLRRDLGEGWALKFGSFKSAFLYEELSSATRQLMSERSVVDAYFLQGRAQQIELQLKRGQFDAYLALSDGWRSNNDWRFGDMWGLTARLGWIPIGTTTQHDDMQAWRGEQPMLAFGIAGHIQDGNPDLISTSEQRNRFLNDTRIVAWTADAHLELEGWTLYAAVMGEHDRPPDSQGTGSRDALGLMIQSGLFVTDNLQLTARAEWGNTDGDLGRPTATESAQDEFAAITLGASYYFWANNAKLAADIIVPLDEVGDVWTFSARSTLTDDAGESGQAALRVKFTWAF